MDSTCYLCGLPISDQEMSGDHAVPKQFITRKQPKAKGFDYGGILPAHLHCNNRFGPEAFSSKALDLIAVLNDEACVSKLQHKDDSSIQIMAINSDCLKVFTQRDLQFFKFIDVRDISVAKFSSPSFFAGKPKANPIRDSLFVALSVLAKSAAALLVSRKLQRLPSRWRVLALPYTGASNEHDFDSIFGDTKPFDIGVKVWIRPFDEKNWFTLYRAQNLLVYFLFSFSETNEFWNEMLARFPDTERLAFEGAKLNELVDYKWRRV